ncbi:MAG: hypothetical protein EON91_12805 [Brevundimonas sp.]|uniref:hypothetical protein n=1 Tax=Brevundimonas sp. TaxID=1871086 RepID=UPI001217100B|nr:hypothetical protein [Brevundimonas sp.]RZJ16552.1 MAG: hypothetical protein EON91_12805 [Brevundimonas sp.]
MKRTRTPSGWIGDGLTPHMAPKLDEARRRQAFRDSNLFRRNSLPADGPVNGWYQHNPNRDRQENCNTMLARGQMPQDPARNRCRRP